MSRRLFAALAAVAVVMVGLVLSPAPAGAAPAVILDCTPFDGVQAGDLESCETETCQPAPLTLAGGLHTCPDLEPVCLDGFVNLQTPNQCPEVIDCVEAVIPLQTPDQCLPEVTDPCALIALVTAGDPVECVDPCELQIPSLRAGLQQIDPCADLPLDCPTNDLNLLVADECEDPEPDPQPTQTPTPPPPPPVATTTTTTTTTAVPSTLVQVLAVFAGDAPPGWSLDFTSTLGDFSLDQVLASFTSIATPVTHQVLWTPPSVPTLHGAVVPGVTLQSADCNTPSVPASAGGGASGVSFVVETGQHVVCTFVFLAGSAPDEVEVAGDEATPTSTTTAAPAPTTTSSPAPTTTIAVAGDAVSSLPVTGQHSSWPLTALALVLAVGGATLVVHSRTTMPTR